MSSAIEAHGTDVARRREQPTRRDHGFTLIELIVVVALISFVAVAALRSMSTLMKTGPAIHELVGQSHDQQQLTNYFYGDVRSTSALSNSSPGYVLSAVADGCGGTEPGTSIAQLTWTVGPTAVRANYRLVLRNGEYFLDRYACAATSIAALTSATPSVTNIADAIDPLYGVNGAVMVVSENTLTMTLRQGTTGPNRVRRDLSRISHVASRRDERAPVSSAMPPDATPEAGAAVLRRDRGAVLVVVLVLTTILGVVSTAIARYATTTLAASKVADARTNRSAASEAGLRLALERVKLRPADCTANIALGIASLNAATLDVDCAAIQPNATYKAYTLISTARIGASSTISIATFEMPYSCAAACSATVRSWGTGDTAAEARARAASASVPGAPGSITAAPGNAQVTLSWSAAVDGGSPVTAYRVTSSPGGLICTTNGPTTCTVTGLTNGTAYTFTVIASNIVGSGPASPASNTVVPVTTPGAPREVGATAGDSSVTVNWFAPVSNGGSPITGYTATASGGGGSCTTTALTCTIGGLNNGTLYTFTVTARNAVGTGPASTTSAAVAPLTIPGAPTGVTASAGNASATVGWIAPASNGGAAITGYTVTSAPGGLTCTTATLTCTVNGLTNGTAYTFVVDATNAAGTGPDSASSAAVTPRTVPGAPTSVTGTPASTAVAVAWTAPVSSGGSPITGYTVLASPGGATCTTAALTCTVNGLTNGTAYTFVVDATNAAGTGADSTPSAAVTPRTTPGAPTAPSAVAGAGSASVSWTAPASNGGSAITGYTVTSAPGGLTCTTATLTCTVNGLTNGTAYTFTVKANNAAGASPASAATAAVTPRSVPGAPTSVTATPGNTTVVVAWTAPASNGGSVITGYTVISSPGALTCTTTGLTCTVTGLTNGTAYTFIVDATNALGTGTDSTPTAAVTPRTIPGAPTAASAVAGAGSATVSWTVPASNGGAAITGYTVLSSPGGLTCTTAALSCTVNGLTNGTAYTFVVDATNAAGTGADSTATVAIVPRTVPGAPTAVTAVAGAGSATVSWTAPASNGGAAITSYTVLSSPGGLTCTTSALTCTVSGLTNGTAYTFIVDATNAAGTGADSAASAAITPRTVPGAPTSVTGTPGNTTVAVAWTAPASNGGSAITGYTVVTSPGGLTCTTTGLTCTVSGLTNGTAYTSIVDATNALGTGADSTASAAVTPRTVPGAPRTVTGTPANAAVAVSWLAPTSNGGSAITAYTATASPGGATCTTAALTCTVSGLTNGTSYTFVVDATNAAGTGTDSTASAAVTPRTVPGAPTAPTASPGNTTAVIAWTAPASNGGSAITAYTATASPGGLTCTTASSTCTVTGLTNGTAYTFTVKATNVAGASAASAATAAIKPGTPAAPGSMKVAPGNAAATITWVAPANNGSAITGYTVTGAPGGTCSTAALTCTISGLTNGTTYTFTVTATNAVGIGPGAVSSVIVGTPTAPTISSAVAGSGADTATVSWTASTANASAIIRYTVTASPGGATCIPSVVTTRTCSISGLTGGSYTFTVTATNSQGIGPASAASAAVTPT